MITKIKAMIQSRRFWLGVAGTIVAFSNALFGEGTVDPETVQQITLLVAAWIVGDSLRVTE